MSAREDTRPCLLMSNEYYRIYSYGPKTLSHCDNCCRPPQECTQVGICYAPSSPDVKRCDRCGQLRQNPDGGCDICYDSGMLVRSGLDWECSQQCKDSCKHCQEEVEIPGRYSVCKPCLDEAQTCIGQFVSIIEYNAMA